LQSLRLAQAAGEVAEGCKQFQAAPQDTAAAVAGEARIGLPFVKFMLAMLEACLLGLGLQVLVVLAHHLRRRLALVGLQFYLVPTVALAGRPRLERICRSLVAAGELLGLLQIEVAEQQAVLRHSQY
jgi:hypothetical protein